MQELKKNLLLFLLITAAMEVPIKAVDNSEHKKYCVKECEGDASADDFDIKCFFHQRKQKHCCHESTTDFAWKAGKVALYTAGASAMVIGATAAIVPALGFGAAGVTAGSLAAGFQASTLGGTIAGGGLFATLQSIGAAGIPATIKALIVGTSGVASTFSVFDKKESENKK